MRESGLLLGVHTGHDCNVSVIDDNGNILFAAGEERFNRKKMYAGFPELSLAYVLGRYGDSIAQLATPRMRMRSKIMRELRFFISSLLNGRSAPRFGIWLKTGMGKLFLGRSLETQIPASGIDPEWPVVNIEHHRAHAAGAFYNSGFEKSWIMTLDGEGDGFSCCFYRAEQSAGIKLTRSYFHNEVTLGRDYEKVTAMLGFHPLRHPGKITGLAAYGSDNQPCIDTLREYLAAAWRKGRSRILDSADAYQVIDQAGIEKLRTDRTGVFGSYSREDIAYAIQWLTETEVLNLVSVNIPDPASENICLAGGVFANVSVNRRVKEMGFRNIFIMPAMTDCGLSLGACLDAFPDKSRLRIAETMFLGPQYSDPDIRAVLGKGGYAFETPGNMAQTAAELLARGKVIARFDGAMEFGPRALGNRSILYQCTDPSVNDWLNKQLRRTEFMPFAPVTMEPFTADRYIGYSGAERTARFMTITFRCSESMKTEAPAVVHVDGTARPQIIRDRDNPEYYAILDAYYGLTGIPSLVNTSFNMHEEPIVMTPGDALKAFEASHLDAMILGHHLIKRC